MNIETQFNTTLKIMFDEQAINYSKDFMNNISVTALGNGVKLEWIHDTELSICNEKEKIELIDKLISYEKEKFKLINKLINLNQESKNLLTKIVQKM